MFLALITIFSLIKLSPDVSEYFFARGISRYCVYFAGNLFNIFPFSFFGFFVIVSVIVILSSFILTIVLLAKKKRKNALNVFTNLALFVVIFAFIYVTTASGCYNRRSLPLPLYEGEVLSAEETAEYVSFFLDDFSEISNSLVYNENGSSVCPYTTTELADLLIKDYERLNSEEFGGYYSSFTPRFKKAFFSKILSYEHISGITFMPTGEAVVNAECPPCYFVVSAAHELAHTKGVMRERDANETAYYLLLTSDVPYFRYCGYMYCISYLTQVLRQADSALYTETMKKYPLKAIKDYSTEQAFWSSKKSILNTVSDFFNDLYLKMSGVKGGTENYSDPTEIRKETTYEGDKPKIVIKINYSDTAKMLLQVAMDRRSAN